MKTVRKAIYALLSLVLIMFLINSVFAITASIGNARMILRAKTGDIIEKTILVRNANNEPVRIHALVSGDLEKYIKIKENNFTLNSGEEKDMPFTIKVAIEGTTETKINIQFFPLDKESGVGLSSTIIIIAEKGNGTFDSNDIDVPVSDEDNNSTTIKNPVTGNAINISMMPIAISSTIILVVVFIILLVLAKKSTKKGLEELNKEIDETKPKMSAQK